ncbi:MAG: hypothetical protein CM15mP129_08240 [Chloroflexota bacterium]|nr:MAG: hypothetical protein CM15mP129_08240 [Chloroflexota bacterium]
MARIFPIKGIMYNFELDNDLGKFLCPPFDVVDDNDKDKLYGISEYNVIRLENGKSFLADDNDENKYTRSSKFLDEWLSKKVLVKDNEESLFILEEIFENNNKHISRSSLICNVKVEDYEKKVVLPHEKTREKQKKDRFELMKNTKAVFSPIMSMIEDKNKKFMKFMQDEKLADPYISGEIPFMHKFNLWKIKDKDKISYATSLVKNEKIFIADGHHRYETSLNYKEFDSKVDKRIMNIFSSHDNGLLLFGYSRAIKNLNKKNLDDLIQELSNKFSLKEISWNESLINWNQSTKEIILMEYNDKIFTLDKGAETISTYEKLHSVFDDLLGKENVINHIEYIHDNVSLKKKIKNNEIQLSFSMNALSKEYFLNCVSDGKLLPPKSTLFYPKLPTGLVIQYLYE